MPRLQLKTADVKKLFALSGNYCAFPGCNSFICDKDGNLIGEICHIEAAEPGGQRYNPNSNDEYRRSYDNLILFCSNHHRVTNNVKDYSTQELQKYKRTHEQKFTFRQTEFPDQIIDHAINAYSHQLKGSFVLINQSGKAEAIQQIKEQHNHYYSHSSNQELPLKARKKHLRIFSLALAIVITSSFLLYFFFSQNSVSVIEQKQLKNIVFAYYRDLNDNNINSSKYFAPKIQQFINSNNISPGKLDSITLASFNEFQDRYSKIDEKTFNFSKNADGNNVIGFWLEINCYRKSKHKHERGRVHQQFTFNPNNKIISVKELEQEVEFY